MLAAGGQWASEATVGRMRLGRTFTTRRPQHPRVVRRRYCSRAPYAVKVGGGWARLALEGIREVRCGAMGGRRICRQPSLGRGASSKRASELPRGHATYSVYRGTPHHTHSLTHCAVWSVYFVCCICRIVPNFSRQHLYVGYRPASEYLTRNFTAL